MISVFSPDDATHATSMNYILYDENLELFENFNDFIASKNNKIFLISESIFIETQKSLKDLLDSLSYIDNYIDILVKNDIDIVFDISTGGISQSYFPDFFKFIEKYKKNKFQ